MQDYRLIDRILIEAQRGMDTLFGASASQRESPGRHSPHTYELLRPERRTAARLMRVNHAGELAAQGLYSGQGLTARATAVRERMRQSAEEERDHLVWCQQRLTELGGRRSRLSSLWYLGSVGMGAAAGLAGDRWSLGFLRETERQVVRHLDDHLARLPQADTQSYAILEQMRSDESHHAQVAGAAGAAELPAFIKRTMGWVSKMMTRTAYWV